MRQRVVWGVKRLLIVVLLAACVRRVPPPAAPEQIVPEARSARAAPAPGMGRLLIGTTTDPALVEVLAGRSDRGRPLYRKLCLATPCSVDMPYGVHELRFSRLDDPLKNGEVEVTVAEGKSAFRYALGSQDPHTATMLAGGASFMLGFAGVFFGTAFTIAGLRPNPVTKEYPYPLALPLSVLAAGAALLALSAVLFGVFPMETQDGTGTQWLL